jgi:hypothetical protein
MDTDGSGGGAPTPSSTRRSSGPDDGTPSDPEALSKPCPSAQAVPADLGRWVKAGTVISTFQCIHPSCQGNKKSKGDKTLPQMRRHVKESATHRTEPPTAQEQAEEDQNKFTAGLVDADVPAEDFKLDGGDVHCTVCEKLLCTVQGDSSGHSLTAKLRVHVHGTKGDNKTKHMHTKTGNFAHCPENRKGPTPGKQVMTTQVHHCSICGDSKHQSDTCPQRNPVDPLITLQDADFAEELIKWLPWTGLTDQDIFRGVSKQIEARYSGMVDGGTCPHQVLGMRAEQLRSENAQVDLEDYTLKAKLSLFSRGPSLSIRAETVDLRPIKDAAAAITQVGYEEYVSVLVTDLQKQLMSPMLIEYLPVYDRLMKRYLSNRNGRVGSGSKQTMFKTDSQWHNSVRATVNAYVGKPLPMCKAQTIVYVDGVQQFVALGHITRPLPPGRCYADNPHLVKFLTPNTNPVDFNRIDPSVKREYRREELQRLTARFTALPRGKITLQYQNHQWGPLQDGQHVCQLCGMIIQCGEDEAMRAFRSQPHCHKKCQGCDKPKCQEFHKVMRLIAVMKDQRRLEAAQIDHANKHGGEFPQAAEYQECCDALAAQDLVGKSFADVIAHVTGKPDLRTCCAVARPEKQALVRSERLASAGTAPNRITF